MTHSARITRELETVREKNPGGQVVEEGGGSLLVILPHYPIPPGFDRSVVRIAIRIGALYPTEKLDLFWVDPGLHRLNGVILPNVMTWNCSLADQTWAQISWHDNAPHDPKRISVIGYVQGIRKWFTEQVGIQ